MNINIVLLMNDYNFYFMYRINKYEWKYFLERPFLINIQDNTDIIYGQFITSNWFKCLDSYPLTILRNVLYGL